MAKYAWPAGSTSKTILLFVQDSASTTGAGKTGLSAGAVNCQQIRVLTNNTVTINTVSTTNLTALTDAYLSGGIFEVSAANSPGWYRFDIPDAALSTGAVTAAISVIGSVSASNIAQLALEIQLQNVPADVVAKAGVTVSVSTLYPVVVRQWDTTSVSSSNLAVTDFTTRINANVQQWASTSVTTNNIVLRSEISLSVVNVTAWAGASVTTANIALWQTVSAANVTAWTGTSVTTANIALWQTISTANVTQWSGASTSTNDIALWSSVSECNVTRWAGVTTSASDVAIQNNVTASIGAVNVTAWAGVTVSASNVAIRNPGNLADTILTRTLTETYATDGVAFTPGQALYQLWSRLSEFSISSQVITSFRLDGTTTAMTFSLDSATAPTKVQRVS